MHLGEGRENKIPLVQPSFRQGLFWRSHQWVVMKALLSEPFLGEDFCKEYDFRSPEMGWVTEFPKCLAPCGRRNWGSHYHKDLESLTKGGVCTQRWGKGEKRKNQNEMDILKSQFSGWQIELRVYREEDVLSSHPPSIFTQKSRNRPKSSFLPVKKMLIYSKDWFSSTRALTKEDFTEEWPHGQTRVAAARVSWNEPLWQRVAVLTTP